jgi:hypothetical protein
LFGELPASKEGVSQSRTFPARGLQEMNRVILPLRFALALLILAVLLIFTLKEPVTPDADDCAARGKGPNCWTEVYGD